MRISCPPTISPCFYGVDTPSRVGADCARRTRSKRSASTSSADTLAYLSLDGLLRRGRRRAAAPYCTSCYTGVYPVAFPRDEQAYLQLALKVDRLRHVRVFGIVRRAASPCCPPRRPLRPLVRRRPAAPRTARDCRHRRTAEGGDRQARGRRLRHADGCRADHPARPCRLAVPALIDAVAGTS